MADTMTNTLDNGIPIDVRVARDGSVCTFTLNTEAARDWVDRNVFSESWQWLGPDTLAIDTRFSMDIAVGMFRDGLVVA